MNTHAHMLSMLMFRLSGLWATNSATLPFLHQMNGDLGVAIFKFSFGEVYLQIFVWKLSY